MAAQKSQMLLNKTIQETKIFFHKTSHNFKSFLSAGFRKLPQVSIANRIFSGRKNDQKFTQPSNLSTLGFSRQWETATNEVQNRNDRDMGSSKLQKNGDVEHGESFTKIKQQINGKIMKEERRNEKNKNKNKKARGKEITKGELSSKRLAKKMKELEMMDVNDVDHVLDVEEVLHYYSRLSSPVYVDIVDKFFVDMHNEYTVPQPTLSANSSMRRSGSMRSNGSMRRLGPIKL